MDKKAVRVRLAVSYCVHDDREFLKESIASYKPAGDVLAFVSRVPWNDKPGDWEACAAIADQAGAEVILGDWATEDEQRRSSSAQLESRGYTHALIPDGDEVIENRLLGYLMRIAEADLADRVCVEWDTYWKSPEYVIRPREPFRPLLLLKLGAITHVALRHFEGGRQLPLGAEYGVVHHLSYVGPDERIQRKLSTWSHRDDVVHDWFNRIWLGWDQDKLMRNLHPTHPDAYHMAERIQTPTELCAVVAKELPAATLPPSTDAPLPTISVVIPLYGGEIDIRSCLESLGRIRHLLHEVIVIDNASPDGAATVAQSFEFVKLIMNTENGGFARASNQGYRESTGEIVLFLNSDAIVPEASLCPLVESLIRSATIGASAPYTDFACNEQRIAPTYTSLATLDLFAEDFAKRSGADRETDFLIGFCLAIRRSTLQEVGSFDERFPIGGSEDGDLCYRLRRAGYKLVISNRSYVHHTGSQTFGRMGREAQQTIRANDALYLAKWREDLETGFASHLSGHALQPIMFDETKRPDRLRERAKGQAKQADISLCMIVKDEERVIEACLRSATPFFAQMIVVDTGSTDRTVEIARQCGATVIESAWHNSFSVARNESLVPAKGRWIFWMDADDTLPLKSGLAIQQAAISAPKNVLGFVVPVQFVDDGPGGGTRVDHVKLVRNVPGLHFEGRIHEQLLPSLRALAGDIARLDAVVMHSGYDTSPEGQAKKHRRDMHLLYLDWLEDPKHSFKLFNAGMTRHHGGRHQKAVRWFRRCLKYAREGESHVRKANALLARSLYELGQQDEALQTIDNGLEQAPGDVELLYERGMFLLNMDRPAEAKESLQRIIGADTSSHFSSLDQGILSFKSYRLLGICDHKLGDYRSARNWWEKSLEAAAWYLPPALELFEAALEGHDLVGARQTLDHIKVQAGPGELWAQAAEKYAAAVGGVENADAFYRSTLHQEPRALGVRLCFARFLVNTGRAQEALAQFAVLENEGVAEAAFAQGALMMQDGDYAKAARHFRRALELNPGHEGTTQNLAFCERSLTAQSHG